MSFLFQTFGIPVPIPVPPLVAVIRLGFEAVISRKHQNIVLISYHAANFEMFIFCTINLYFVDMLKKHIRKYWQ